MLPTRIAGDPRRRQGGALRPRLGPRGAAEARRTRTRTLSAIPRLRVRPASPTPFTVILSVSEGSRADLSSRSARSFA